MHEQSKAFLLLLLIISESSLSIRKAKYDYETWKKYKATWFPNYTPEDTSSEPPEQSRHNGTEDMDYQNMEEGDSESPSVDLFISEVNLDKSVGVNGKFVELFVEDFKPEITSINTKLLGFSLILIRGSPLAVVMTIPLKDFVFNIQGPYIVIGDSTVANMNIDINHSKLKKSYEGGFPDMDDSPFAFVICYSRDEFFHDQLIMKKTALNFNPIGLTDNEELKKSIFITSMDAVVVGRKTATNQCDYFSSFFPQMMMSPTKKYILRDWDSKYSPTSDFSINYCCEENTAFSPACFKLGAESPGKQNDCSKRRFVLEFEISSMSVDEESPSSSTEVELDGCNPDFPGLSASKYARILDSDYSAAVRRVMSTSQCEIVNYNEGERTSAANKGSAGKVSPTEVPVSSKERYIKEFDNQSFKKCKQYFSNYLEVLTPEFKSWVELSGQDKCVIKCRVCQTYFAAGWRVDQKKRTNFQKKGHFSSDPSENQRAIRKHLANDIHSEAMEFYQKLNNAATRIEQLAIESAQHEYELTLFRPTMNEVQLGYAELRTRSSFRSHKLFMNAVSNMGVNVGTKHRHEGALQQITSVLSKSFHKRLLEYLVKNNKWFSIICDGTCNRQVPYFACLFQSLENNRPMVYMWRLLTLSEGEVGQNMVQDVQSKIEEDSQLVPGFKEYFKSKIVASVSDGASNMVGNKNSFYTHLRDYAGRHLVLVKCLPHRLQRAVIHAINFPTDQPSTTVREKDRKRFFRDFSKINNQVYTFYMSRGSKRFQSLVELGNDLDIPTYRINYFFDIRWAASHKRCMMAIYRNYDVIRADLDRITSDHSSDDSSKIKALELNAHFSDKAFPVVVAEFVDLLMVIEKMSERFQQKGGIMIGNVAIIKDGYDKLGHLSQSPGTFLSDFLSTCSCPGLCQVGKCTLQQYDQCKEVNRERNQVLRTRADGIHTINLSAIRSTLYVKMQQQLETYFEFEKMEVFEVFNNKYFKKACEVSETISCASLSDCYKTLPTISADSSQCTPEDKIAYICRYYKIQDCSTLVEEWKVLMSKFVKDSALINQETDAVEFWSDKLNRDDVVVGNLVRDVIERIMATAFTSADAERAFSLVSSIKTPDRSSLSPGTLESLVRIQFNGPEVLSQSRLFEYTKEYIKVASRVDDTSQIGGRSIKSDSLKYTSKSDIF